MRNMKLFKAIFVVFGFGCFTYALFVAALANHGLIVNTYSQWPRVVLYGLALGLWLWATVMRDGKESNGLPK